VGNLPLSTSQTDLYKEFFIFGEISKIDLKPMDNQSYAYIKFRLINSALKALEQNDKMNYKGNIVNISLSNVNQRRDIKGNEIGYEINESNCKLIVVCLNKSNNLNINIF
jgi:RNA recognition motif-containing protein